MYETLILDLDEGIRGLYDLLRMCTEINMPVEGDALAAAKVLQFEEELHILGYEDCEA